MGDYILPGLIGFHNSALGPRVRHGTRPSKLSHWQEQQYLMRTLNYTVAGSPIMNLSMCPY